RLRRVVLSLPWLALRHCGPHPKRSGAGEPPRADLFIRIRHRYPDRLRGTPNMSAEHSTYQPSTGIEKWVDSRLPLPRMIHDSFVSYPVPRNLNYAYTFGAML